MRRAKAASTMQLALVIGVLIVNAGPIGAQDTDGDGRSDELERRLATDPEFVEPLELIAESPVNERLGADEKHFDITRVRFGNVAQGRWLWAIEFAESYTFDNTLLILYVDADNDPQTGRPGMGCETTYGHRNGRPSQMFYLPDEQRRAYPPPRVALEDGVLYISADLPLHQQGDRATFRMQILSEQAEPHESRDALGFRQVEGPGDSDRKKVVTLADLTNNENFEVTQSMDLLWELQADESNAVLNSYQDCEFEGFEYYDSEYRWPALRKTAGSSTITATVPESGRFFPGVIVYDSPGAEGFEMSVDGEVIGRFTARADNRRQRLFFAQEPLKFAGGETITLRAGNTGAPHIVEDIVLLSERPPVLKPPRKIRDLQIAWDWQHQCMRATWWTTWPVACTLTCGNMELTEEQPVQNHRIYMRQLEAGRRYICRIQADGVEASSEEFAAGRPHIPRGTVQRGEIELSVLRGRNAQGALTAGIPFPNGELANVEHLRLLGPDRQILPLQARPLARGPDGTIKVALIDTQASEGPLTLEYGESVSRPAPQQPIHVDTAGDTITVSTDCLRMRFHRQQSGLFTDVWVGEDYQFTEQGRVTRPDRPARISIIDDDGKVHDTLGPPESIVVEEAGTVRTVVRIDGHHTADMGRFFTYQVRFTFFKGADFVNMSYRWGNDTSGSEFAKFRRIRFELPLEVDSTARFVVGADEPIEGELSDGGRVEQLYDNQYSAGAQSGERAPGWIGLRDTDGLGAIAICRHFWQLYPKALGAADHSLYIDISPDFAQDQYNDCSELDLIKLYYYLQDARYKVRQGVTKTHDIQLRFLGAMSDVAGLPENDAMLAAVDAVNRPAVLAAPPEYCAATGVFGDFVPRTAHRTARYDQICERVHQRYVEHRDRGHEFGMLNYGDQWGERRVNWDNGEYDHHHAAAQMFLRSADAKWFDLMRDMARHDIDVDLCHYHSNPRYRGASWIHSMGHTGRYFDRKYQGEWGIPHGGMTVSHTWCEGTCEYYMLTGDPAAIEAARRIADHYGGAYLNDYDFTNGRVPGWHLILTMAVYRTTGDPCYLNAARIIVERVLQRRTPDSGWARQLVPGHCHCWPRCRGACSFMQGILGVGLREYYLETRDERIPPAVVDSAHYVIDEMWVEQQEAFRYTSCPHSSVTAGRSDTLAGLLLFAHELSGDPELADIAQRSMNLGFGHLGSVQHLRWTPYIVHALDRLMRESVGIGGGGETEILLKNREGRGFELRLCDRNGRAAPPHAAQLVDPDGHAHTLDETGRVTLEEAGKGVYRLRIGAHSGPWQFATTLNPWVLSLRDGAQLAPGEEQDNLYLAPRGDNPQITLNIEVLEGRAAAGLFDPNGKQVATASGTAGGLLEMSATAAEDGMYRLALRGPARVRLSGEGIRQGASRSSARYFNASAPSVRIEGDGPVLPGRGRTVRLHATVQDPENDAVQVRWQLPDGSTRDGAQLVYDAPYDANVIRVRAVATDAEGNTGSAAKTLKLPPAELTEARTVLVLQAEDFTAQGGGEVRIFDRVGDVGRMITYWHAELGHWLEWQFDLQSQGEYLLYARYASGGEGPRRALAIDGRSLGEAYDEIAFEPTGGYCTERDRWQFKKLGPPVRLTPGEHTLRMTNLGDGLAMDYLAIALVNEIPKR